MSATILLAEHYMSIRCLYRELLSGIPDLEVVGEASNGAEMIELVDRFRPDVVVIHPTLFDMDCKKMMARLGRSSEKCPSAILINETTDLDAVSTWKKAGVKGLLTESAVPDYLAPAVQAVLNGKTFVRTGPRPV